MSLLSIAKRVTDEVGLPTPSAVATGTDQLARQLFALANATLEELGRMNWPCLQPSYEFTTVINQESYPVPPDFKRFVTDTAWLSTLYYQMRGSLTAAEWTQRRNGLPSLAGRYRFRAFGDPFQISITPVPQLVETVVMEYVTTYLAKDVDGIPLPLYESDSDVARVPEELVRMGLKWRIKHAKGLDYSEDYNKYEENKAILLAQQLNLGSVAVAYRWNAETPELGDGYVPEQGYGS